MLKIIKSVAKSLALAMTILYGAHIAPQVQNQYIRWEVGESVVRVVAMHSEKSGGTGFAVQGKSGTNYIMTNRHVCGVQQNGVIRVKVGKEKPVLRKVVYEDDGHDLCLIEGIDELSPISIGEDQVPGEFLYAVGHPGLRDLTVSKGEYIGRDSIELIQDVETREQCTGKIEQAPVMYTWFTGKDFICIKSFESLATTAVIYGGNSGSPAVNEYGNLIGVVFAGNREQDHDNYIVPLSYVKKVLSKF
jgi:S1-C subfamily serine protease